MSKIFFSIAKFQINLVARILGVSASTVIKLAAMGAIEQESRRKYPNRRR